MMKKIYIIFVIIMCFALSACGAHDVGENGGAVEGIDASGIEEQLTVSDDTDENTDKPSENNKTKIAEALEVDENNRSLRFVLNALDEVNAGEIKNAEAGSDGSDKYVKVTAENDTVYRIYLSDSESVEAVENMDTGEWPIRSER